jgi:hypothetical protein
MTETVEPVRMGRYAALYAAWMIGLSLALVVIALFVPDLARKLGTSASIIPKLAGVAGTYQTFVGKHARLLTREEYWKAVTYCAAVSFIWEAILLALAILGHALPQPSLWAVMAISVVVAGLISFGVPAIGFSDRVGNYLLNVVLKRRAAAQSR